MKARLLVLAALAASMPLTAAACAGKTGAADGGSDAGAGACTVEEGGTTLDAAQPTGTACSATIETPPRVVASHIPVGSPLECHSNPPTSGPHFPKWAAFKSFDKPVPRGFYLHDEEHGAIVLLYKCAPGADCGAVRSALEQIAAAYPEDPLCKGTSNRAKFVVTPDPDLDVPVAAAAWGWAYKAQCVDPDSLGAFAREHYDKGPEQTCADGVTDF